LAKVFTQAKNEALTLVKKGVPVEHEKLRRLDHRAQMVLALFAKKEFIAAQDAAQVLGLSTRMARFLMKEWVEDGWLVVEDTANRSRTYSLSRHYKSLVGISSGKE
jgi:predicted ArsR family transcriptional regulator